MTSSWKKDCELKDPQKPSKYEDVIIPGYYYPGGLEALGFQSEDEMLTNFAWGVVDLRDNSLSEVAPEVGAFKAISRKRDDTSFTPTQTDI